jgi:hypothetical protein
MKGLWLCLALLALTFCSANGAVFRGTTGILEGKVIDKLTKEPLVGVNVTIAGTHYGAMTDTSGRYWVNNVRANVYQVRYSLIGHKSVIVKDVTILPDLRTRIDVEMEISAVEMDVIEVHAQKPLIQKDLAATAFSFGELKIDRLPVSSFREVMLLQPGTTLEGNVRGGKTTEVMFLVDGMPVQDLVGGGLGTSLPKSSITGMTIHTGGFDAEYGNAMSGVVNVITRSGGDKHTLAFRAESDNWLLGDVSINQQQDRLWEFELTAGGPIVHDKLFYFAANSYLATDTRWWQDFEKQLASPISQEVSGFGKLDYLFSTTSKLSLQGLYSLRSWRDYEFSWRFNLPGLPSRSRSSYRGSLIYSETVSDRTFYTVSLNAFHLGSKIGEGDKAGIVLNPYQYDFYLQYILSGQRNWWADVRQNVYTFKGDFTTRIADIHIVRVGVEANQYNVNSDVIKYEPQTTYFGKPIVDAPMLNYSNKYSYGPRSGSVYIQDKVEVVRDGSNASVGLRWDFFDPTAERPIVEFVPVKANEYQQNIVGTAKARFKHQLSPRLSLAVPVGPTSFFFVNFGHYFQFPLFDYLYSGISPAQLRGGARNVLVGNPDLEPERSVAWEFGVKHSITADVLASATYFRKDFHNQIDSKTLIPFDSKSGGDFGFAAYVNNATADASGFELVLSKEHSEELSGSISYTYMITEGMSEGANQAINYAQWGFPVYPKPFPLSWDQRHAFKIDADFVLPYGIQGNAIVWYNTPRPYTYYPTRDGFTPLDTIHVFIPNNKRMSDVFFVNLKMSKKLTLGVDGSYVLTLYIDARNLLNNRNVRWMDSGGRIGGELGDPSAYYDPRRIRIGAKLEF